MQWTEKGTDTCVVGSGQKMSAWKLIVYFVTCVSYTSQKDERPSLGGDGQTKTLGQEGKEWLGSFLPASQNYSFISTTGKLLVGSLRFVVLLEVEKQLKEENLCF